ncbi:MAG: hypothetical protein EZS28_023339 [Streblomastix strix]|uniref:Uncharacterized protein n=1 Tax=Streblomastix strix TaxID=222440 RepID=A0A5J4VF82_9EUKA|nr:MAG: hypothetical protein EZS28_023339 [Streblomastix strix]
MAKIIVDKIIPNHLKYDYYVDLDQIRRRKEEEIRKQLQVIKQLPGIQKYTGYIDLTEPKQYTPYERSKINPKHHNFKSIPNLKHPQIDDDAQRLLFATQFYKTRTFLSIPAQNCSANTDKMETEQEIQDVARAIISLTDSQAYKKEKKQNEQPESESTDCIIEIKANLQYLGDIIRNNIDFKQMIKNQNLLRPLASLTIFKLGNYSNQEVDRLRFNVRCISRDCLSWILNSGDAQDFADLVNVGYGKVICISLSTAGGIGEEKDEEIWNVLIHFYWFLINLHEGRNELQPSFQPLPLLARITEEQIEEEGAIEEVEAQMSNNGFGRGIKICANDAKSETLNHFIYRRRT